MSHMANYNSTGTDSMVREEGEATCYFCICRNYDSLAVAVVAHFDPRLAGRLLAAIGKADDCFCRL